MGQAHSFVANGQQSLKRVLSKHKYLSSRDEAAVSRGKTAEMGTREVYEEKLRRGNLHHDPTINPGLGSARCPRCLSLIDLKSANGEWTITSVLRDASVVAGSGLGGLLTAVHGFNTGIPFLENRVRGPKWLPFVVGLPPLLLLSGVGAAFGGYVLPKFAQLTVTSYYASSSASSYGISLLTRQVEDSHTSQTFQER